MTNNEIVSFNLPLDNNGDRRDPEDQAVGNDNSNSHGDKGLRKGYKKLLKLYKSTLLNAQQLGPDAQGFVDAAHRDLSKQHNKLHWEDQLRLELPEKVVVSTSSTIETYHCWY